MITPRRSPAPALRSSAERRRGDREKASSTPDPEEYVELVLSVVEEIPRGRVTSYGAIAGVVGGGPRQVGAVMSRHGGPVPWWRVVRADGSLPPSHEENARPHYLDEGTPLRPSGAVDMAAAFWEPEPPDLPVPREV
ncbi:MGMT family protein [Nocardioides halotolerans]|uniref:MGMT family protein n=1 Tax=Nocardioides halotolerans TaxID=433660 RepID=UPI0004272BF4